LAIFLLWHTLITGSSLLSGSSQLCHIKHAEPTPQTTHTDTLSDWLPCDNRPPAQLLGSAENQLPVRGDWIPRKFFFDHHQTFARVYHLRPTENQQTDDGFGLYGS